MTITNKKIEEYSEYFAQQFEQVNLDYVERTAKHIRKIGRLKPEDIDRVEQLYKMNSNIESVNKILEKKAKISAKELNRIYEKSTKQMYSEARPQFDFSGEKYLPFKKNLPVQNYLNAVKNQTANTFFNISRSTQKSMDYTQAIDRAIQAVTSGLGGVDKTIHETIKQQAKRRICVTYPSGRKLRIDSAVRMNVRDGIRQLQNEEMRIIGNQFGADGIEIDAHGLCAPDHLPYQGRQFKINKFFDSSGAQKMDTGRPIGKMNCQHGIRYVILAINKPAYSKEQLKQMKDFSNEKIKINDKEITRYEADQLMRKLETKMRDVNMQLDVVTDENLKSQLKDIELMYNDVARSADLKTRYNRAKV